MLFAELALIRWVAAYQIYVAYFTNFVLLASFLGIGVGFLALAGRGSRSGMGAGSRSPAFAGLVFFRCGSSRASAPEREHQDVLRPAGTADVDACCPCCSWASRGVMALHRARAWPSCSSGSSRSRPTGSTSPAASLGIVALLAPVVPARARSSGVWSLGRLLPRTVARRGVHRADGWRCAAMIVVLALGSVSSARHVVALLPGHRVPTAAETGTILDPRELPARTSRSCPLDDSAAGVLRCSPYAHLERPTRRRC